MCLIDVGTQPTIENSDKSTFLAHMAIKCLIEMLVKALNEVRALVYSKMPIENKRLKMDCISTVVKLSYEDYLQQRLLQG